MREERTIQASIFDVFSRHELGRELKAMSDLLDDHRQVCGWVAAELRRHGLKPTGRKGLPAETVLRCAVLKQHRQLSYEELAFYLTDSASFRAFARLPVHWTPKKSVLQKTISAISAETWDRINCQLLRQARKAKLESGEMLRVDSMVGTEDIRDLHSRPRRGHRALRRQLNVLKRAPAKQRNSLGGHGMLLFTAD